MSGETGMEEGTRLGSSTVMIVLYRLPLRASKTKEGQWVFSWDEAALYQTSTGLRRGLAERAKVLWIGIINTEEEIRESEKEEISGTLLRDFSCVPVFVPREMLDRFYRGFCKTVLWPLFHGYFRARSSGGQMSVFDKELWFCYMRVNRLFSNAVISVYQEGDLIWVHDYHLMVLPYNLRQHLAAAKIGLYLHTPWPSSEIYRVLPVRQDLLRGVLSASVLGFHLFDYARHFLSCCVRLLNLEHEMNRGNIVVECMGRHVNIRVSHIGVDPERFAEVSDDPVVLDRLASLKQKYPEKFIYGAIDDLDPFKGIVLKIRAFQRYLRDHEAARSEVVLVQIAIPRPGSVPQCAQDEIRELVASTNAEFKQYSEEVIVYMEQSISFAERVALYRFSDVLLLTPIKDGLNLIPYEYIVSCGAQKGQMILSEFTGCSKALSGAIRVNPWNVNEVADAIHRCRNVDQMELIRKKEADIGYVQRISIASWAASFLADLEEAREPRQKGMKLGLGLNLGFRLLEFDGFEMLNTAAVLKRYRGAGRRLILLDYDGTLISENCSSKAAYFAKPSDALLKSLRRLGEEKANEVYIMSGRSRDFLEKVLGDIPQIGLAAEHGLFHRSPRSSEWNTLGSSDEDFSWMAIARDIMDDYVEKTDGAYIEEKTSGLVWHFLDVDREFGQWQARELHDELDSVLGAFNIQIVTGMGSLQVRQASLNKGVMVQRILGHSRSDTSEDPDFVLCIGDDRSDEDMFSFLTRRLDGDANDNLFTCTVGVKPSDAKYYLRSSDDVESLLGNLAARLMPSLSTQNLRSSMIGPSRTFDDLTSLTNKVS
eukprot:CAMPEP_0184684400 /NCGR_PEP_ID=MMETSP0312-20130426/15173_1 /TAXON_ID=31354 /ORGANISM="Compsopogon coeruleus, Strain SAG 36.94" /LENGTH=822 /DNA_ID=CAMNT_0027137543 /DNA_START=118 /DNA_END=2586 /DNA_ORIENTATION=+